MQELEDKKSLVGVIIRYYALPDENGLIPEVAVHPLGVRATDQKSLYQISVGDELIGVSGTLEDLAALCSQAQSEV